HAALDQACRGHGSVLLLRGDAGIGKTRLIEEVAGEAERRGARALLARAYESSSILPFRPWVEAFRGGRLVSTDLIPALGGRWRNELTRLFPELSDSDVPPPITPELHVRLFEAVDDLVAHVSATQPLVVLLDDLHWADEMSLRLLVFLGRHSPRRP